MPINDRAHDVEDLPPVRRQLAATARLLPGGVHVLEADVPERRAGHRVHRRSIAAGPGAPFLGLDLACPLLADIERGHDVVTFHRASTVDFPRSEYCTRGWATWTSNAIGRCSSNFCAVIIVSRLLPNAPSRR